ncbi:MAG: DinB family protein [Ignavibacteriales bacterium]|nr:DinB family protein [Ignavibacteriales bacterium]
MTEKDMFLKTWEMELPITIKVLKAYPADRLDYKPHEKNRTARDLAWIFVGEQSMIDMALKGKLEFGPTPPAPKTMDEIIAALDQVTKANMAKVKAMSEENFNSMIEFPVGPGKVAPMRKADIFWLTIMDAVHHRGQMSVYIRLAGGKVPAMYGPSADENWGM